MNAVRSFTLLGVAALAIFSGLAGAQGLSTTRRAIPPQHVAEDPNPPAETYDCTPPIFGGLFGSQSCFRCRLAPGNDAPGPRYISLRNFFSRVPDDLVNTWGQWDEFTQPKADRWLDRQDLAGRRVRFQAGLNDVAITEMEDDTSHYEAKCSINEFQCGGGLLSLPRGYVNIVESGIQFDCIHLTEEQARSLRDLRGRYVTVDAAIFSISWGSCFDRSEKPILTIELSGERVLESPCSAPIDVSRPLASGAPDSTVESFPAISLELPPAESLEVVPSEEVEDNKKFGMPAYFARPIGEGSFSWGRSTHGAVPLFIVEKAHWQPVYELWTSICPPLRDYLGEVKVVNGGDVAFRSMYRSEKEYELPTHMSGLISYERDSIRAEFKVDDVPDSELVAWKTVLETRLAMTFADGTPLGGDAEWSRLVRTDVAGLESDPAARAEFKGRLVKYLNGRLLRWDQDLLEVYQRCLSGPRFDLRHTGELLVQERRLADRLILLGHDPAADQLTLRGLRQVVNRIILDRFVELALPGPRYIYNGDPRMPTRVTHELCRSEELR